MFLIGHLPKLCNNRPKEKIHHYLAPLAINLATSFWIRAMECRIESMNKFIGMHPRILVGLEHGLIIFILGLFYFSNIGQVPFHADESSWIGSSNVFEEYFNGHFNSEVWDNSDWQLGFRDGKAWVPIATNSTITRFFIGIGRRLGGYSEHDLNGPWDFSQTDDWNLANGNKPIPGLLFWSRLPMAFLAVLSIYLIFFLIKTSFGRVTAYILVLCFVINPYFLLTFRRAMDEAPLLAGISLTMFAAMKYLQAASGGKKQIVWLALLGFAVGFSGGAKLYGLATAAVGLAVVVFRAMQDEGRWIARIRSAFIQLVAFSTAAYLFFLLPNPFLLTHPVTGPIAMLQYRTWLMPIQFVFVPARLRIGSFSVRMNFFFQHVFSDFSVIRGVPVLVLFLGLLGAITCVWFALHRIKNLERNAGSIAILVTAFCASLPTFFINIDLDRYYILPVVFSTIFLAIGIGGSAIQELSPNRYAWLVSHRRWIALFCLLLGLLVLHGTLPLIDGPAFIVQNSFSGRAMCLFESPKLLDLTCIRLGYPIGSRSIQGYPIIFIIAVLHKYVGVTFVDGIQTLYSLFICLGALSLVWWVRKLSGSNLAGITSALLYYTSNFMLRNASLPALYPGLLLFPFYVVSSLVLLQSIYQAMTTFNIRRIVPLAALQFLIMEFAILISGYSYAITVTTISIFCVAAFIYSLWKIRALDRNWLLVVFLYGLLLLLPGYVYKLLVFKTDVQSPSLDFFRGQGIDLITLLVPTQNLLFAKLLHFGPTQWNAIAFYGNGGNVNLNYLGYFTTLVGVAAMIFAFFKRSFNRNLILTLTFVFLVGFTLSLGPSLKINDTRPLGAVAKRPWFMPAKEATLSLPSEVLFTLPVISAMRYTYRWQLMSRFALAALVGFSIAGLLRHRKYFAITMCVIMVFENLPSSVLDLGKTALRNRAIREQFISEVATPLVSYIENKRVLFLPSSNDYLATIIAPFTHSYSYNLGFDKELNRVQPLQPSQIIEDEVLFGRNALSPKDVCRLFKKGLVDKVVFTYFSLSVDAWNWPPPQDRIDTYRQKVANLHLNEFLGLTTSEEPFFMVVSSDPSSSDCSPR